MVQSWYSHAAVMVQSWYSHDGTVMLQSWSLLRFDSYDRHRRALQLHIIQHLNMRVALLLSGSARSRPSLGHLLPPHQQRGLAFQQQRPRLAHL
jgi:hypothetical protein